MVAAIFFFLNHSVVSDSLRPHGLYSPWNSPGWNTGVGSHSLLQGIFPTQGSNPGLPHCRRILYQLSHKASPRILKETNAQKHHISARHSHTAENQRKDTQWHLIVRAKFIFTYLLARRDTKADLLEKTLKLGKTEGRR